jgi:glycosyltransferase involved in cell wall biosynthesis
LRSQTLRVRRPRVLIIAESANPESTSVPLVGWSHSRAIAALTDAYMVTHVSHRQPILRAGLVEGKDFTAIDSERVARPIRHLTARLRGGAGRGYTTAMALAAISYYYFESLVWRVFAQRLASGEFDLVHRLTPLSPTIPSLLASKCRGIGVPFVLGPLNGGVPWPKGFGAVRRQEKEWLSYVRAAYKLLPGYHSTRLSAATILIGSRDTWRQMPSRYLDKCFYIPENGIDPARFTLRRRRIATKPLRVAFVGRLVPLKGVDMLLAAAASLVRNGGLSIDIIGDGPQYEDLQAQVQRAGMATGVQFHGRVEHQRMQEYLVTADILAFPSIREFGGAVVLEAMALGVVPLVMNYGGPGELVTSKTGFLVQMGSRQQIIARFHDLLERLVANPEVLVTLSERAIQRTRTHFTWQAKAQHVLQIYRWVLGDLPSKPQFAMPMPELGDRSACGVRRHDISLQRHKGVV